FEGLLLIAIKHIAHVVASEDRRPIRVHVFRAEERRDQALLTVIIERLGPMSEETIVAGNGWHVLTARQRAQYHVRAVRVSLKPVHRRDLVTVEVVRIGVPV